MSLTGCSQSPGCLASIHASPDVKAWFKEQDLPDDVVAYLKSVGDEQAAIDESCSGFWFSI